MKVTVSNHPDFPQRPVRRLSRRNFLALAALSPALVNLFDAGVTSAENSTSTPPARLLFTSQGKTGIVDADGRRLRYFDFQVPDQATWQPGPSFPDGKRLVFLSME